MKIQIRRITMKKQLSLVEAMSIGIGGMVGGGIFAVLGLAVSLAKGSTPIAFLLAGIIAFLTAYSYAKLSLAFPDTGGTVRFIDEGFGESVFSGFLNNLLWISYIIMLSLYASAFGSYAPKLFSITNTRLDFHIYATAIVIIATIINYYSLKLVGMVESYAVIFKLIILLSFIAIGFIGLRGNPNLAQLTPSNWVDPIKMFAGGMIIFVAYEGFELIANAAPNIENKEKNIKKAYLYSVIFVILLYIAIAVVTVGSLEFSEIQKAEDYALAEAAKPMLGKLGFVIITIAALISTFSAINASIYGAAQVNYDTAKDNELPHSFLLTLHGKPIGLMLTVILTLIMVNTVQLEVISTAGSIGFLLIFGIVNFIAARLSNKIGAKKYLCIFASIMCLISCVVLVAQQIKDKPLSIIVSLVIILSCLIIEFIYRKFFYKSNTAK